MDHFRCKSYILCTLAKLIYLTKQMYWCMMDHPGNTDSQEIRATKECELSAVFMQYLSSAGSALGAWKED